MASRNDKYIYLLITREKNGKYVAYVQRAGSEDNILPIINSMDDVCGVSVLPEKKAEKLAKEWNNSWKEEGKLDYNILL